MEKLINAMPVLTSSILALFFIGVIGWQVLNLQTEIEISDRQQRNGAARDQTAPTPAQSVELRELTFFGEAGEKETPRVADTEDLPETNLQLVRRGVMAGDDSMRDSALVEGPNGETRVYRLDQSLPGNARLLKVHSKRIVIERSGELETLSFPENNSGEKLAVADSASNRGDSAADGANQGSTSRRRTRDDVRSRLNKLRERLSNE